MLYGLQRSSQSPFLWLFEWESGRVKRKKQSFILLSRLTKGSLELLTATSLSRQGNQNPVPDQGDKVPPASPGISMPFRVMGGNKSPFAYTSWRWDSDTTLNPYLSQSPFWRTTLGFPGQRNRNICQKDANACRRQNRTSSPIPLVQFLVLSSIMENYYYKSLKIRTTIFSGMCGMRLQWQSQQKWI